MRVVAPLLLLLAAAGPAPQGFNLQVPASPLIPLPPRPPVQVPKPGSLQAAPMPNRDLEGPTGPRADDSASVAPSLFNRSDQFRGDGYSRGSTNQTEVEKRVKPGAGINLRMPFSPN